MRAVFVDSPGGPERLVLREVPAPEPGPGQLLLDVHATALNRADLLQRRGLYPPPPGESDILGLECAGTVIAVGPGVDPRWNGRRVMALLAGGGYAERAVIPIGLAMPIPEQLSFVQAAAIPEAFLTAAEALFSEAQLGVGETVLVHAAAGGVGSAAVQLATLRDATIFAVCGDDNKCRWVETLGAKVCFNRNTHDFAEAARVHLERPGVDVILDFVGGRYWPQHADLLAAGGRLVSIGVLGGSRPAKVDLSRLLRLRQRILGLVMRTRSVDEKVALTRRFTRTWLHWFDSGRLRPLVDSTFPLARVREAHERLETNSNRGKIVLEVKS